VHCDVKLLKRHQVGEIIGAGLQVRCYTVNDGRQAARLLEWGVQSVITDYPDRMP
jgi:glycerophosphoryl diester phosphodiesterase